MKHELFNLTPATAAESIVSTMSDAFLVVSPDRKILSLNRAALSLLEYEENELIGQPVDVILAQRDENALFEGTRLNELLNKRRISDIETTFETKNGKIIPISLSLSVMRDNDGRLRCIVFIGRDITERKRADEILKTERKAFHIIAEAAVHATDTTDLCRRILTGLVETLEFDAGVIRLYDEKEKLLQPTVVVGHSEEEAREKFPPQSLDDSRYIAAHIARTRQVIFAPDVNEHEILQTHNTRLKNLGIRSIISWPILGVGQKLLGVIHLVAHAPKEIAEEDRSFFATVVRLFTTALERKQAEEQIKEYAEELKASEERYRGLYESSIDGIVSSGIEGNIVECNQAYADMHGYTKEEMYNMSLGDLMHSEWRDKTLKIRNEQVIGRGYSDEFESVHIKKDGTIFPVAVRAWQIKDKKGNTIGGWGIVRDITERKQAEEKIREYTENLEKIVEERTKALRESEEKLRAILTGIGDLITIQNRRRDVIWVNQPMKEIYGDTVIGTKCYTAYKGLTEPCPDCIIEKIFNEEQTIVSEKPIKLLDGRQIHALTTSSPVRDIQGNIVAVVEVAKDITELKNAEEKLKRTLDELSRSNTELEQFAYIASHDLQEPLRMIVSFLQLLERRYKDKLDKDADEFIAFAVDGATRMQQMINDLLTYSRVGTRGKPFEITDSNIVFGLAIANLKVAIEENNAIITHDSLPTVMADASQLILVFQNLIGNAIKFRSEEPPQVHVSSEYRRTEWIFSVRDNGIGIDPEYFERIFLIFQRLNNREEFPGSGIGLAICKKIVERHGGRIWIDSQPGKGSTFYFTIPTGRVE